MRVYRDDVSPKSVRLRRATDADAPAVLVLQQEANAPYRHRPGGPIGPFTDTVEGTRVVMTKVPVMLAITEGVVAGCVFYAIEGDHCFLFRLAVLPAHQRCGIGRALIAHVETRAGELGLPCVRLGVRKAMPENRGYYERLGYRVIEETEGGWAMEKRLDGGAAPITYTIREATDADVSALVRVLHAHSRSRRRSPRHPARSARRRRACGA